MILLPLFLDIETSALEADKGVVTAVGIQSDRQKTVRGIWEFENEKEAVEWVGRSLKGEKVVTWYGSEFDFPFLLTRASLLEADFHPIEKEKRLDLYSWCKENLNLSHYSLKSVAEFFGIEPEHDFEGKDMVGLYKLAEQGNEEAKSAILNHCRDDIKMLKEIYQKIEPYL